MSRATLAAAAALTAGAAIAADAAPSIAPDRAIIKWDDLSGEQRAALVGTCIRVPLPADMGQGFIYGIVAHADDNQLFLTGSMNTTIGEPTKSIGNGVLQHQKGNTEISGPDTFGPTNDFISFEQVDWKDYQKVVQSVPDTAFHVADRAADLDAMLAALFNGQPGLDDDEIN